MSTISNRRTNTAADMPVVRRAKKRSEGGASFRYGYRYAKVAQPDGRTTWEMVPLTLLDVLHPQFGDVHVLSDPHGDDTNYLKDAFKERYKGERSVVVFSDCGIFWDVPRLTHHSPDLALIFGVKQRSKRQPRPRPARRPKTGRVRSKPSWNGCGADRAGEERHGRAIRRSNTSINR